MTKEELNELCLKAARYMATNRVSKKRFQNLSSAEALVESIEDGIEGESKSKESHKKTIILKKIYEIYLEIVSIINDGNVMLSLAKCPTCEGLTLVTFISILPCLDDNNEVIYGDSLGVSAIKACCPCDKITEEEFEAACLSAFNLYVEILQSL